MGNSNIYMYIFKYIIIYCIIIIIIIIIIYIYIYWIAQWNISSWVDWYDMMIPSVWVYIPLELNYTKYRLCINKPYGVGYKKYIIFEVLGYTYYSRCALG